MRKCVGEYNDSLKKLYGSLRKRFKLDYDCSLDEVDKILGDDEFSDYAVILISNDDIYSKEFVAEVNEKKDSRAFGFYKDGVLAYTNVQEVREMVPKLIGDVGDSFVYVSVDMRSQFRLTIPKTICIKQGKSNGELTVDVIKTRPVIENEIIRMLEQTDLKEFNELLNSLYINRWERRPDIFDKGYKLVQSEISNICNASTSKNIVVCVKDDKIVGFIFYEYVYDGDNRGYNNSVILTIKDIYVDSEYRRQKIATKMYEKVVRILEKFKSNKLKIKVWAEDEETKQFIFSLQPKELYTLYEIDI